MVLLLVAVVFGLASFAAGAVMVFRRARAVVGGKILSGTVVAIDSARSGGAFVHELTVATDPPVRGTYRVRAYRLFEVHSRIRIRTAPDVGAEAWLAEWSHLGYEIGIGVGLATAGVLAWVAAAVA